MLGMVKFDTGRTPPAFIALLEREWILGLWELGSASMGGGGREGETAVDGYGSKRGGGGKDPHRKTVGRHIGLQPENYKTHEVTSR